MPVCVLDIQFMLVSYVGKIQVLHIWQLGRECHWIHIKEPLVSVVINHLRLTLKHENSSFADVKTTLAMVG